jgi:hypothetical protein
MSVRVAGRDPRYGFRDALNAPYYEEKVTRAMFCLDIAIENKDPDCLRILWDQY